MIDWRLLQTFVQAARSGSFTEASLKLQISPAAVSQNIKSIEDQLGVRLFNRTTRQTRLTLEGQQFLSRCQPAMEALDEAVQLAGREAAEMSGQIRLTSTTAFGRAQVLPLLSQFMALNPLINIEFELNDGFVDLVAGEYDFAIRAGVLPENEYISRLLVRITPTVCATPEYFEQHGKPKKPQDVVQHRCIGMLSNPKKRIFEWEFAGPDGFIKQPVEPVFVANDPEAAVLAAVQGTGLAQLGTNLVEPYVKSGQLEIALSDYATQSRGIYLVYPSKRFIPARVKALMDYIAESLTSTN